VVMDPRGLAAAVEARAAASAHFLTYRLGSVATRPAKGYVVLSFGGGAASSDGRITGSSNRLRWGFTVRSVGYTDDACLFIDGKFRALFLNWRPDPDPGAGWLTEDDDDPPILPDTVEGDTRYALSRRFHLYLPRS
jgi:hypothetical protein